ncbi:MAG: hypothetical protein ACJA1I_000417, partial [Zhongshania marina]
EPASLLERCNGKIADSAGVKDQRTTAAQLAAVDNVGLPDGYKYLPQWFKIQCNSTNVDPAIGAPHWPIINIPTDSRRKSQAH